MTETKKRIENIKQRLGYTVDNRDAYVWSLDAKFLLDLNSSLETKLKKALHAMKEQDQWHRDYDDRDIYEGSPMQISLGELIKELESV